MVGGRVPTFGVQLGASLRERLPGELVVDLPYLSGELVADVARDLRVRDELRLHLVHGGLDLARALPRGSGLDDADELLEVGLLVFQDGRLPERPVTWPDHLCPEGAGTIERRNPLADVAVAHVVVGTVHAGVAREKDLLPGQT